MFLDFTKGHWLSIYRNRIPEGAPPLELLLMTNERRAGVTLANDVPTSGGVSGLFVLKMLGAWIAIGFRRPEVTLGKITARTQ